MDLITGTWWFVSHLGFQHPKAHCLFGVHAQQQVGYACDGHSPFLREQHKHFHTHTLRRVGAELANGAPSPYSPSGWIWVCPRWRPGGRSCRTPPRCCWRWQLLLVRQCLRIQSKPGGNLRYSVIWQTKVKCFSINLSEQFTHMVMMYVGFYSSNSMYVYRINFKWLNGPTRVRAQTNQ